jgi:RNase H-fold protein (predicted Holliday junction resolvase)
MTDAVQGNNQESPDNLENLVNTIQNSTVTPTAVEIEHHNNFLTWLHSIDFNKLHDSIDKYVVPALDIALPLLTDGTVSPKTVKDFYRFKFIFDLYKQWDEQVKTNTGNNNVTK